jgi:hypothetical protein
MISQRFGITDAPGELRFVAGPFRLVRLSPGFSCEVLSPGSVRIEGAEQEKTDSAIAIKIQPEVGFRLICSIEHRTAGRR